MAAGGAVRGRLSQTALEELLAGWTAGKPLPVLHFCSPSDDIDQQWTAIAFLVRSREHGFMVALPHTAAVEELLYEWCDTEGNPIALTEATEVRVETMRGRQLGRARILLVDLPWTAASVFRRPIAFRRETADRILRITVDDQIGRPKTEDVWEASEKWLAEKEQDDVLQEYVSAESGPGGDEEVVPVVHASPGVDDQTEIIRQLQERIHVLEASAVGPGPAIVPQAPAQELFPMHMASGALKEEDWQRLQQLAGPPPRRLPKPEGAASVKGVEFDLQAEVGLEAQEEEALAQFAQTGDPIHRILALQMQQTQALLRRMAPKTSDPLRQALGGSFDSSHSSSGVKGCHAREIYVRQMEDLVMIAKVTQQNVLSDLGYSHPFPGLMREFIEKRVPLGEMRTLTLMSQFLASGWEVGYNLGDMNIMGLMAKGLMMTEQFCLDGGRATMGWLLTAVAEPNFAAIERNKQRRGLRPYSKLASPSWLAANIAFLKDMDYMETRLKDGAKSDGKFDQDRDVDKDKDKRAKAKAKGKAGGKGSKTPAADASEISKT